MDANLNFNTIYDRDNSIKVSIFGLTPSLLHRESVDLSKRVWTCEYILKIYAGMSPANYKDENVICSYIY